MPRTPDRFPGTREEEAVQFIPGAATPQTDGEVRYVTGTGFQFLDEGVLKRLYSDEQHAALRQLIHLADNDGPFEGFASGAYEETLPLGSAFPTSITWWTSSAKTHKIVENTVTYNLNFTIATDTWKSYDTDGSTVLATFTDTFTYSGVFIASRTRTY